MGRGCRGRHLPGPEPRATNRRVDGTDLRTRPSDGGDEPGVVGASAPVRAELAQPVVCDVVAKTEDGVRRESDDGLEA